MQKDNSVAAGAGPFAEQRTAVMEAARRVAERCRSDAENIGHSKRSVYPCGTLLDAAKALDDCALLTSEPDPRVAAMREALSSSVLLMEIVLPSIDGYKPHQGLGLILDKARAALASPPRDGE